MQSVLERIEKLLIAFTEEWQQYRCVAKPDVTFADEWLRADEVMELLSISQRTLYNYCMEGAFDTKRLGRTKFYSKASVMRLK